MCGRYTVAVDPQLLAERFGVALPDGLRAALQRRADRPGAGADRAQRRARADASRAGGSIPHWAKEAKVGARMINARAETLAEKPAYRPLLAKSRCLILADGFYEWRLDPDGRKRPVRYTLADGAPFGFAGLWTSWRDPESGESAALLHDHHDDARTSSSRPCTTACR